jgi:uncharacterized protein YqgV (UPF0045/DUF77 family)
MVVWVAMAAKAALIRAVPLVAEAIVHPAVLLPATVLKVDQAAGEVARIQVKAKAVTDKTTRYL